MADIKGSSPVPKGTTWVQTERKAHEAWAELCIKKPRAAAMLHRLVSLMQPHGNVVVISMGDLAKVMGCVERTAYRAADDLIEGRWVKRIKVSGSVFGFVVNTEVAWAGFRAAKYDGAVFTASVVSPRAEMDTPPVELRRVPILFPPGERALPQETGGEPGQQLLPGTEPSCEIRPEDMPRPEYDPRQMTIDDHIRGDNDE
jgi:hypothetical protein